MAPPFEVQDVPLGKCEKTTTTRNAQLPPISTTAPSPTLFQKAYGLAAAFNWPAGSFIVLTHLLSIYALFVTPYYLYTCLLNVACFYVFLTSMTAGYHRLWSHRTYQAHRVVKVVYALLGTGNFSMSVIDWAKDHRAHHKYTDTDRDPYNSTRGFYYCHIGWLFWARKMPKSDVRDLKADPFLRFQHKFYAPLAFLFGWGVPILIAGLGWQDWKGGFYISLIRIVIAHHIIFSINSVAHLLGGNIVYSHLLSARDNIILAILTAGEGYHNFHHEFPNDYRNGVRWYSLDITKWLIALLEKVGLSWDLNRTPAETIAKAEIQTMLTILQQRKEKYFWGRAVKSLPVYAREFVEREVAEKKVSWVIMNNIVYDVSEFLPMHPGGDTILKPYLGKDITKAFNGGVYAHTNSAKLLLDTLRIGVISDEMRCL